MKELNEHEIKQLKKLKIAREYNLHIRDYLKIQLRHTESSLEGIDRIINDIELGN